MRIFAAHEGNGQVEVRLQSKLLLLFGHVKHHEGRFIPLQQIKTWRPYMLFETDALQRNTDEGTTVKAKHHLFFFSCYTKQILGAAMFSMVLEIFSYPLLVLSCPDHLYKINLKTRYWNIFSSFSPNIRLLLHIQTFIKWKCCYIYCTETQAVCVA